MNNKIYDLLFKQLKISTVMDLRIKWKKAFDWLGYFQQVSRSFDVVADYLRSKTYGNTY